MINVTAISGSLRQCSFNTALVLAAQALTYYASHETVNPTRIVPLGPEIDYAAPHDRGRLSRTDKFTIA